MKPMGWAVIFGGAALVGVGVYVMTRPAAASSPTPPPQPDAAIPLQPGPHLALHPTLIAPPPVTYQQTITSRETSITLKVGDTVRLIDGVGDLTGSHFAVDQGGGVVTDSRGVIQALGGNVFKAIAKGGGTINWTGINMFVVHVTIT